MLEILRALPQEAQMQLYRATILWTVSRQKDDTKAEWLLDRLNADLVGLPPVTLDEARRHSGAFPLA